MALLALALAGALGLATLAAVLALRPRALGLALPLALGATVVLEALLLEALSLAGAVRAWPVAAGHLALAAALLAPAPARAALAEVPRRLAHAARGTGAAGLLVLPAAALALVSGARHAPGNWDSMTYHLARVAHWLQHGSVAPFPTGVARQVTLPPGAEYLQAALQAVAGTDRLAFVPQALAYGVVVLAAPPLARLAGAPRWLAPWAALLAGTVPMAILQASSTQNDLVAAALAVALVAGCAPLLRRRPRAADVLLLAAAGAAAVLVKSTALLAAAPAVVAAGVGLPRALAGPRRARLAAAVAAGLVLCAAVAGPSLATTIERRDVVDRYVYPALGAWGDRAVNAVRGAAHHLPVPRAFAEATGLTRAACGRGAWCARLLSRPHEDYAGNAAAAAAVLALLALGAARWRRLPGRARAAVVAPVLAWLVLHALLRENAWLSRLQLPLFALSPLALGACAGLALPRRAGARAALGAAAAVLALQGAAFAAANVSRPPFPWAGWRARHAPGHYVERPAARAGHDRALAALRERGCARLGLRLGPDDYDYPLTWRAMQAGAEVRHVDDGDPWPCVLYSDVGPPASAGWVPAGERVWVAEHLAR